EMLKVISFCHNDVFVPITLLYCCLNRCWIAKGTNDLFLAVSVPNDFLSPISHDLASHSFFIEYATVSRPHFNIRLVSPHDPLRRVEHFASVLNAGVAEPFIITRDYSVGTTQFEISYCAIGPYEESISLRGVFCGRLARDRTILDTPELGIAIPTGEVLAVKQILIARFRRASGEGRRQQQDRYNRPDGSSR